MKHEVTPVVFIHGSWLHASSWDGWVKLFRRLGYDPVLAPGWPGEPDSVAEARLLPEQMAGYGINEITEHYAQHIATLDRRPVVIGHSFGGLIAQKLLADNVAAAAIAIASVQPKGVWKLPLRQLAAGWPVFRNPFSRNASVALTANEFRYGFGNTLSREESAELYTQWAIPAPARPLWQVAWANVTPRAASAVNTQADRGPLFMIAGGRDNTIPASVVRAQYALYSKSDTITDIQEFPDRGHSLHLDSGWREVADIAVEWLKLRVHQSSTREGILER